jgi:hypothetical protein
LLIATLRDDVLLDVETKILKNSFVTIINDKHWFVTQFSLAGKIFCLNLVPFSPKILIFSFQKLIQLFTILKNQRKLAKTNQNNGKKLQNKVFSGRKI